MEELRIDFLEESQEIFRKSHQSFLEAFLEKFLEKPPRMCDGISLKVLAGNASKLSSRICIQIHPLILPRIVPEIASNIPIEILFVIPPYFLSISLLIHLIL